MADGRNVGRAATCKSRGNKWPSFGSKMMGIGDGVHQHHREKSRLRSYRSPNYGEWFDWTGTFVWDEDEMSSGNNAWSVLYMYGVEEGVDISVDTFRIDLPSEASYANQNDVCGELVVNGDAEVRKNGMIDASKTTFYFPLTFIYLFAGKWISSLSTDKL